MKVLVCGGRNYTNRAHLWESLDRLNEARPIDLLIEGGAEGADKLAARWAEDRGIDRVTVWANWTRYKNSAGHRRNQRMLDLFHPDLVVAAPGGKGTRNMINKARVAGVKVWEIG